MALAAAALLDELMGRNRNVAPNEKGKKLNWEDSEYCKYYLVKFCPHDLFVNTRADLGVCTKIHDEEVKKLFAEGKSFKKILYQEEFVRFCQSMINDVDRKIIKGKQRLELKSQTETIPVSAECQRNTEEINTLTDRINSLVEKAEQAGYQGNVDQAQDLMKLCDKLKEERDSLKRIQENPNTSSSSAQVQEKQMEVCEVCGAFLIVGDAQQRIDDHLMGKQHVGFARIKAAIQEVQALIDNIRLKSERPSTETNFKFNRREPRRGDSYHRDRDHNNGIKNNRDSRDKDRNVNRRHFGNNTSSVGPHRNRDRHSHHRHSGRDRDRDRDRNRERSGDQQSPHHSHRR
ncbi:luc7-like protein 3 [Atheta coriaria]|uniref:luc7-like protein 3 n=1 Tax=Dalotia coriaria TaxID=877792 RepID=UPI0031F47075